MELLALIVIGFAVYKLFFCKKKHRQDKWPDEQIEPRAPKKKGGCMSKLAGTLCGFCVVALLSMLLGNSGPVESTPVESPAPSSGQEAPVDTNGMTPAPTDVPTPAPTAAPNTPEEWVIHEASKIYGDDLISVEIAEIDGDDKPMITINHKFKDLIGKSWSRDGFVFDAREMMEKISILANEGRIEYGSCYILG